MTYRTIGKCVWDQSSQGKHDRKCEPLLGGTLKLNVDEAARGKPGPAAIGRYLTMIRRSVDCFFSNWLVVKIPMKQKFWLFWRLLRIFYFLS